MSYLTEAFKALDALNEETFDVSADGIKKLADFENLDDNVDETTIFDMDAETEDDIEDSYIGKVIIDCNVCHSKIYKDKDEVVIDDETNNANIDMECPYCYSTDGFKVIGEVAPMNTETEEKVEDDIDIETHEDSDKPTTETEENVELEESLNEATTDRVQNLLNIIDKSFEVSEDDFINEAVLDEDNKIRLSSIPGVTRDREGDFTDDGNRFQAYLYKGLIPITYLRSGSDVYISIAFHHLENINYEEYKEFPSYKHVDDFNGVSVANFDPQVFKKNLDAAYDDVTTFLGNVQEVDPQQLEDRIKVINKACKEYEEKVKQYIKDNALNIMKIPDYQFRQLKSYVISASNRTADAIRDASAASKRDFMSTDIEKLKERISSSWNFKYIEDILNSVKESFNEATVTDYKGSLSNILVKNKDKISKMATKGEIIKFLDSITDEVRDKNYLETVKSNMQKKNDFGALQYIYGIILSGEGKGVKESLEEDIGKDIDEYQQWVDYDMKRYGKISNQTNKEIKEAGLQVVKDKYGDYQVIAGKYDESLKESNDNSEIDKLKDYIETAFEDIGLPFNKIEHTTDNSFIVEHKENREFTFTDLGEIEEELKRLLSNYDVETSLTDTSNIIITFTLDEEDIETPRHRGLGYMDKYVEITNEKPSGIPYKVGDIVKGHKILAYLKPKKGYKLKARNNYPLFLTRDTFDNDYAEILIHYNDEPEKDFFTNVSFDDFEVIEESLKESVDDDTKESFGQVARDKVFSTRIYNHYPFRGAIVLMDKVDKNGEGRKLKFTSRDEMDSKADELLDNGYISYTYKRAQDESFHYSLEEPLKECVKDVTITTDDSKTTMTSEDDGKVTVTTEPVEDEHFEDKEVVKPLDDETIQDIETNSIDDNESEEDETVDEVKEDDNDEEETEFAENEFNESFSKLCENYLKENYSNVESFKATKSTRSPKQIIVEGLIKFTSGKVKNTKFSFNENISTKNHKGFQGKNLNITKDKAPFLLKTNSKMVCEALSYNYRTKNDENKKVRCKGIVKEG